MKKLRANFNVVVACVATLFTGCSEEKVNTPAYISFEFEHAINGSPVEFNSMGYINAANNEYEVTEVQWFLSRVTFIREDGHAFEPLEKNAFHYVDTKVPETMLWRLRDPVPAGNYRGIRFTFGFRGEDNIPGRFPNPPENGMVWPSALGGSNGGYHYMKLNGFWNNAERARAPFNFHLGVGQLYDDDGNVTAFVQNWFEAELPSEFTIEEGGETTLVISMGIDSWFRTPNVYDHNLWGGSIMRNQEAQRIVKENGFDVFTLRQQLP